jgi:hypothetical protein
VNTNTSTASSFVPKYTSIVTTSRHANAKKGLAAKIAAVETIRLMIAPLGFLVATEAEGSASETSEEVIVTLTNIVPVDLPKKDLGKLTEVFSGFPAVVGALSSTTVVGVVDEAETKRIDAQIAAEIQKEVEQSLPAEILAFKQALEARGAEVQVVRL